jgi:hypothetical protein
MSKLSHAVTEGAAINNRPGSQAADYPGLQVRSIGGITGHVP